MRFTDAAEAFTLLGICLVAALLTAGGLWAIGVVHLGRAW